MKIKPLIIDFAIPDYLQEDIDNLIQYVNENEDVISMDCYECEVYASINAAKQKGKLTQDMANVLLDYYVYRGWMKVENVKTMEGVRNVVATMAIEGMYLSQEFVEELEKVTKGEKTSEELRREVIKKYKREV